MTDALEEAEALLLKLPDAVARRKLGERLTQAIIALRTADHQIARITALLELSRIVEFGKTIEQRDALEEMRDCAAEIGASLEEAEDAEELRSAVYEYENSLKKAIATLERAVRERWRVVAAERFQPLIGIGNLLTSMNVSNNLGGRLADCGRKGLGAAANAASITDLVGPLYRPCLRTWRHCRRSVPPRSVTTRLVASSTRSRKSGRRWRWSLPTFMTGSSSIAPRAAWN